MYIISTSQGFLQVHDCKVWAFPHTTPHLFWNFSMPITNQPVDINPFSIFHSCTSHLQLISLSKLLFFLPFLLWKTIFSLSLWNWLSSLLSCCLLGFGKRVFFHWASGLELCMKAWGSWCCCLFEFSVGVVVVVAAAAVL